MTWEDTIGWFDWNALYDEVALTTPPYSTIVEVGVAFGRSLLYLAQKIKETGKDIKVVAVDPWLPYDEHHFIYHPETITSDGERQAYEFAQKYGGVYEAFRHCLNESGLASYVDVRRMTSVEAAQDFQDAGVQPHFVFIDAEHKAESVKQDIDAWWALGPEWIAGHDYNRGSEVDFPGVWKTVDAKWGQQNVEWVGQTCFVVRRSHLERPR